MTTFNITGSISTNDPISASYIEASNIDGAIPSSSYAGTASVVLNASVGGINGMAYFTSSTVWTVPSGIKNVRIIAIGGGGGGAGGNAHWPTGYAGGGGGYSEDVVSVNGFSTIPITVGTGGTGGNTFTDSNGTDGNLSGVFNITASGGSLAAVTHPGAGGSGMGGTINTNGQSGDTNGGGCAGNLPWEPVVSTLQQQTLTKGRGGWGFGQNGQDGLVIIYY